MILRHMSLLPKNDARRAAMIDCKRITWKEINLFVGTMTDRDLRGKKEHWASAIDVLILSQGNLCYLPLGMNDALLDFPVGVFQRAGPDTETRRTEEESLFMLG